MKPEQSIPTSVWTAYVGLLIAGFAIGILSGAGSISGEALAIFILGSLTIFIPWAIWQWNPDSLAETDLYRKYKSQNKGS